VAPVARKQVVRALRRAWFPVARCADLERPRKITLLGDDLVVFRTAGGGYGVASNRCPHRGAGLDLGEVHGDAIACPYHGWQWRADGSCARIPSLGVDERIPPGVRVQTHPAEEAWGLVWTCLEAPVTPLPALPELEGLEWRYGHGEPIPVQAGIAAVTENFRDVAHFPFVHHATMGDLPEVVEPLDVRRDGIEVRMARPYLTHGGTGSAIWERQEPIVFHYHVVAPSFVCLLMDYGAGGKRILLNASTPHDAESSTIFWVEGVTSDFVGPSLEECIVLETQVYAEDTPILNSLRPREVPFGGEATEYSVAADRYTLAYRRAFLEFVARATGGLGMEEVPEVVRAAGG
jgi:phenylpropionate dioxygenase-like ring-hydroxylating dioxygenase large terminal subunit